MPNDSLNITLPLKKFLDNTMAHLDKVVMDHDVAFLVSVVDKEERFVHVQFDSWEGKKLERPLIWRINDWRIEYERIVKLREKSAVERRVSCINKENIERIANEMSKRTGLQAKDCLDMAISIYNKGTNSELLTQLGIKFEEAK